MSIQMCSTRLMGDTCFNYIVDKNIHLHKAMKLFPFMPYGLPYDHCELPENCYCLEILRSMQYCPFIALLSFELAHIW